MNELINILTNTKYGWLDQQGIYHNKIDKDKFMSEYRLSSPSDFIENRIGICFDMVEYIREYLDKNQIPNKSFLIIYQNKNTLRLHSFIIYKDKNEYIWIEYAFKTIVGLRKYHTFKDCLQDIEKEFLFENNLMEPGKITYFCYEKPVYNIDAVSFINHCQKSQVITKDYNIEF